MTQRLRAILASFTLLLGNSLFIGLARKVLYDPRFFGDQLIISLLTTLQAVFLGQTICCQACVIRPLNGYCSLSVIAVLFCLFTAR